ncbi:MAG: hypothetical protein WBD51_01175, partial [Burkholderiaceae bacterium]
MADDVAEQQPATGLPGGLLSVLTVLICVFGIIWVLSLLDYANVGMVSQQAIVIMLGLACAAAFLRYPYGSQAGLFEVLLA